jgi:hypothetical protein
MNEKKANPYRARHTIHLQERLIQFASLSYNELASAAIDQARTMEAVAMVDVYPTWGSAASTITVAELRQSPTILTAAISAATVIVAASSIV